MDILPCCYSDGLADDDVLPLSRHSPNHRQDLKARTISPPRLLSSHMRAWVLGSLPARKHRAAPSWQRQHRRAGGSSWQNPAAL